jgi:hypothetical protein
LPFLTLGVAVSAAGCGPRLSARALPAVPVEAAEAQFNPTESSAVFTAIWDSSARAFQIEVVDSATGSPAPGWSPIVLEDSGRMIGGYASSPAGDRLAVLSGTSKFCSPSAGGSACWPGADRLHVIDLDDHSARTLVLGTTAHVPTLAFSPDGRSIALTRQSRDGFRISQWRFEESRSAQEAKLPFLPSLLEYSTSGHQPIVLGSDLGEDPGMTEPGPLTVAVLEADSLEPRWHWACR